MWWSTFLLACDRGPGPSQDGDGTTTLDSDSEDTGFDEDTAADPPPPQTQGPQCPEPAWARVVGGEGTDTVSVLGATYDGALALLGASDATSTFDVGDGPISVGWAGHTAWVAVLEEDDGALRW